MNTENYISKEQLLADGWTEIDGSFGGFEKPLENRNPLNRSEDTDIKLILHGMYNGWTFAVLLPNGGMLNFVANCMEDLKRFKEQILFYDCPY